MLGARRLEPRAVQGARPGIFFIEGAERYISDTMLRGRGVTGSHVGEDAEVLLLRRLLLPLPPARSRLACFAPCSHLLPCQYV